MFGSYNLSSITLTWFPCNYLAFAQPSLLEWENLGALEWFLEYLFSRKDVPWLLPHTPKSNTRIQFLKFEKKVQDQQLTGFHLSYRGSEEFLTVWIHQHHHRLTRLYQTPLRPIPSFQIPCRMLTERRAWGESPESSLQPAFPHTLQLGPRRA